VARRRAVISSVVVVAKAAAAVIGAKGPRVRRRAMVRTVVQTVAKKPQSKVDF
jgi:predicted P-loop ATPase